MTTAELPNKMDLRALVNRYRVLWSILPKQLPKSMNGNRIGFEIELWGTHSHPVEAGKGECYECGRVREVLREIADSISPVDCDFRMVRGAPIDARSSFSPRDGFGRSVRLGIEVICRNGRPAVAEQCDAGCIIGMRDRLIALGARRI